MQRTGLMYAALAGKDDCLRVLLEYKADVNAQDQNGFTALHFAAQDFRPSSAALLCAAGADVNRADNNGMTPIARAVFAARDGGEIITLLLTFGADPTLENKHGISALALAKSIANYDALQYFPEKYRK